MVEVAETRHAWEVIATAPGTLIIAPPAFAAQKFALAAGNSQPNPRFSVIRRYFGLIGSPGTT